MKSSDFGWITEARLEISDKVYTNHQKAMHAMPVRSYPLSVQIVAFSLGKELYIVLGHDQSLLFLVSILSMPCLDCSESEKLQDQSISKVR